MKKIIFSLFSIITFFVSVIGTNALTIEENKVVTDNGYELSFEEYNTLSNEYEDDLIDVASTRFLNAKLAGKAENVSFDKKYIVTTSFFDKNKNEMFSINKEVSKEEFENVTNGNIPLRGNSGEGYWETNAKYIFIQAYYDGYDSHNYIVEIQCHWKTTPQTKSYDIIAARWTGSNISVVTASGEQRYSQNGTIYYSYLGNNMVKTNSGVGISMNLKDSGSQYILALEVQLSGSPSIAYGTYQHATSNISLSNSKSYSFVTNPNNGLGGVISHTYASYYDDMQGVVDSF